MVADTETSSVNGETGELWIAGWPVGELSGVRPFEEVCGLLWRGELDAPVALGAARTRAFRLLPTLGSALERPDGMDALRSATAQLERSDPAEATGAIAVFAAAWARAQRGESPVAPDPESAHAHDYLRMLFDIEPTPDAARAMDAYLTTVVDHGMNASTFAARVVASTESDLVSSVVAALGALKGRLHGGAPGPVLDMLDAVGRPEHAEAWIRDALERGERIMGMGHRVYRVRDPRAAVLERAVEQLHDVADPDRLALARSVERSAERLLQARKPGRRLRANVEFYTAVLLEALGLPRSMFTPTFACARVVGWCAHYAEQRAEGRLIRPRARYVGPRPGASSRVDDGTPTPR